MVSERQLLLKSKAKSQFGPSPLVLSGLRLAVLLAPAALRAFSSRVMPRLARLSNAEGVVPAQKLIFLIKSIST